MQTKDWIILILVGIIVILAVIGGVYYHKYQKSDAEIILINDSLSTYKNKYAEEYTAKNTYILKAEQLEQYNKELANEYKSLKDNPIVIVQPKLVYKTDTIVAHTDTIREQENYLTWCWSAKDSTFYKINGESTVSYDHKEAVTAINELIIDAGLTIDVIDDGANLKVLAKSSNPYITIPEMSSVVIDPEKSPTLSKKFKQKKWGIGPYIGLGLNFGYGLAPNLGGADINVGGSIGICVSYHIFEW